MDKSFFEMLQEYLEKTISDNKIKGFLYPKDFLDKNLQYYALFKRWDIIAQELDKTINLETPLVTSIQDNDKCYLTLSLGQVLYAFRTFICHQKNTSAYNAIIKSIPGYKEMIESDPDYNSMNKKVPVFDALLAKYNEKNTLRICEDFSGYFHTANFCEYNGTKYSLAETFFSNETGSYQPVTDVIYNDNPDILRGIGKPDTSIQTLAALQIADHHGSLVLDEVGMGKTVSAMYVMSYLINTLKKPYPPTILIICPYNKQGDWESDIMRHLGLYSNKLKRNDLDRHHQETAIYQSEPYICILGQKEPELYLQTKTNPDKVEFNYSPFGDSLSERWDLIIIDECHNSTDNYWKFKANNLLMLTATPIQNGSGFEPYLYLFRKIPREQSANSQQSIDISPLEKNATEKDWFVLHYKEDMFGGSIQRKIIWKPWKRNSAEDDQRYLRVIQDIELNKGFLASAQYLENDSEITKAERESNNSFTDNKLKALLDILAVNDPNNKDSVLIFIHHQEVGKYIYSAVSKEINDNTTLLCLRNGDGVKINRRSRNSDAILDLKKNIAEGHRSILIINDDIGSTGLNFGEFDAVVNYELPFTSNQLEQRFGRIERADTMLRSEKGNTKTFVLFYNEPAEGSSVSPFLLNRKLGYCASHLDDTLCAMPVRNTVIFHPRLIEIHKNALENLPSNVLKNSPRSSDKENLPMSFTELLNKTFSDRDNQLDITVWEILKFLAVVREKMDKKLPYFDGLNRILEKNATGRERLFTDKNTGIDEEKLKLLAIPVNQNNGILYKFFEEYDISSFADIARCLNNVIQIAIITSASESVSDQFGRVLSNMSNYMQDDENLHPEKFLTVLEPKGLDALKGWLLAQLGKLGNNQRFDQLFYKKDKIYYTTVEELRKEQKQ